LRPFDASGVFQPSEDDNVELRLLAVQGAGATVLSSGLGLAIQIVATAILARLLTAADFGLVTMVTTFSLLLVNFGLNGFTEAVLQWEEISHALASNLFWINLCTGALLTIGFAATGSLLARFYGEPRVAHVTIGISSTIFLTSASVLHLALLKRAMRFSATSANDILSRVVSVGVAILLASTGWGYWALVAGAVAQPLSSLMGAWFLCRWVPGLPRALAQTRSMLRFAMNVYGRFSLNYFARNLDNLLVGWRFQAQALGFYKKAYDLFALSAAQLVSPLANVAVSALRRLSKDPTQYKRYLLKSLSVTAFVGMGLGADLTLVGKDVIRLLLGPGWEEAGRIFTFFGPGIGIMLVYYTHGWIHLSIGRADRWFRWGILELISTGLLFALALPWGPVGVAAAWTLSFWILTIPAFWYAGNPINLQVSAVIATLWKYPLASLLAGCISAVISRRILPLAASSGSAGAFLRIVAISALFIAFYLSTIIILHGGCVPLLQVARLAGDIVPNGSHSRMSTITTVLRRVGSRETRILTSDRRVS